MNKIKAARNKANLTQWQLAIEVGVSKNHISAIERDFKAASVGLLRKIAKVLGVHAGELID